MLAPDGTVTPDLAHSLPGRGIYVTADRAVLAKACERNMFARAARGRAVVPDDLVQRVGSLARSRALAALGQARRAGLVVVGFQQVREALGTGRVLAVVSAADAAENGRKKIAGPAGDRLIESSPFTASETGAALGRSHVVHLAVLKGRLGERVLEEFRRVRRLGAAAPMAVAQE